jgi:DNA-binding HxlR family transcriptional regulator
MEPVQPNVLDPNCGSRRVLDLIADRWSVLVIYALDHETRRYSDLERLIGGISQKMLTQTLRGLERHGIVVRTVYPVVPPHVEYKLTPLGITLVDALRVLCTWAQENLSTVEAARTQYDQQALA